MAKNGQEKINLQFDTIIKHITRNRKRKRKKKCAMAFLQAIE